MKWKLLFRVFGFGVLAIQGLEKDSRQIGVKVGF